VLFEQRALRGIVDGSVTMTFRRWKRPQAVAGRRYRTPAGFIEADAVEIVRPSDVVDADARRAGYASRESLLADLRGSAESPLYRISFHFVGGPDPRHELAHDADLSDADVAGLDRRLARLDRLSRQGPWTATTLAAIAARPAVRAADLAASLGRERDDFKRDVRKLKEMGLTLSLERGYRLSPRGAAYLEWPRETVG
jgi:hypothetical protein